MSDFSQAVAAGGLSALEAVRDALTADLEACQSFRDRAALYNRLLNVIAEIDKLRPLAEADDIDALRNRRNRRVLGASRVPLMRD
jgi:uncharacterized protein HemX